MDVVIAVVNIAICVFAFSKGAGYIKNKNNQMDWWWQTNAAMVAISAVGIVVNIYIISKAFKPKGGYDYAGPVVPLPAPLQVAAPAPAPLPAIAPAPLPAIAPAPLPAIAPAPLPAIAPAPVGQGQYAGTEAALLKKAQLAGQAAQILGQLNQA